MGYDLAGCRRYDFQTLFPACRVHVQRSEREALRLRLRRLSPRHYFKPETSLLSPVGDLGNRPEMPLVNRVASTANARQEKQLLLDVGSQAQEVHYLSNSGTRNVPEPCQFCLPGDGTIMNETIKPDRQRHKP
jgi:hypothetical protein